MPDIVELRQENSKTYDLGNNKRQLVASVGAVHFKDNYADFGESWKDIDLNWEGNKITKAPYELTLDGQKLTLKDKKTGEVSTIELLGTTPANIPFKIVPEFSSVKFQHILTLTHTPFEAKFAITGKGFTARAYDDEGELALETSLVDGILTEKLSQVKDRQTGKVRPLQGSITIDPTWQVGASADDEYVYYASGVWGDGIAITFFDAGYGSATDNRWGGGARFLNVTIPQGSLIDSAYLTLRAKQTRTGAGCNTVIIGEDVDNATAFSTLANYQGRRGSYQGSADFPAGTPTTAYINWDGIADWTINTDYNSLDFKAVIKEIIDRAGWVSGNALAIFWDDHANRSSVARRAYSYDGSTTYAPKLVVTYTSTFPNVGVYLKARAEVDWGGNDIWFYPIIIVNGVAYQGSQQFIQTGSVYYDYHYTWGLSPVTGLAWTDAELANLDCRVRSNGDWLTHSTNWRITQVWVEITRSSGTTTLRPIGDYAAQENMTAVPAQYDQYPDRWNCVKEAVSDGDTSYLRRGGIVSPDGVASFLLPSLTVQTDAATNITQNSAQLNGTLTNDNTQVVYVSFEWGLTASYTESTLEEAKLAGGTFFKNIGNNLTPDTTYHFRAKARVGTDYFYGSDLTFRTGSGSTFPIRLTGIKHSWSAGPEPVYKAEVFIGGLQSSYLPPISDKEPLPSIPQKSALPDLARLGLLRTGTAMSGQSALFQYGVWLSQHTSQEIQTIFHKQPTFAEWWAWYQVYGRGTP